jgi:predicted MPP superfamily phosphohydrolase
MLVCISPCEKVAVPVTPQCHVQQARLLSSQQSTPLLQELAKELASRRQNVPLVHEPEAVQSVRANILLPVLLRYCCC